MGSERPENCPVDSFQWRTGGSPGKGVATIEDADIRRRQKRPGVLSCAVREAGIPPAVRARILTETSIESVPRTRGDD